MRPRSFALVSLAAGLAGLAGRPAFSDCPPPQTLHGQLNPGDQSNPGSILGVVTPVHCPGPGGSGWGGIQVCISDWGACSFTAGAAMYFPEQTDAATAWCTPTQTGLSCTPQNQDVFDFRLFSLQGAIDGHVTRMPSGLPARAQGLWAHRFHVVGGNWENMAYTTTDDTGYYAFKDQSGNNWGLFLFREGASGPGSAFYRTGDGGFLGWGYATIGSNTLASIDLVIKDSDYEEPERPDPCRVNPPAPSPGTGSPSNVGPGVSPPTPPGSVGRPVAVTTGNAYLDQTDATIPGAGLGLLFTRSYNSQNTVPGRYGAFGPGWSHSYDKRLTFTSTGIIKLRDGQGMPSFYQDVEHPDGTFEASMPYSKESQVVRLSATEYRLVYRRGGYETYTIPGGAVSARLSSLVDASGNVTGLTYDESGRLKWVTDPGGRRLTLTYTGDDPAPRQLQGPAGLIATFTYAPVGPALNALQSVTYADGDGDGQADGAFTFAYHPDGRLWTVTDGAGTVLETHVYSGDRVSVTSRSGDVERYSLTYDDVLNTTTVEDALGHVTTYHWQNIWGARRVTRVVGPCAGCGGGGGDVQEWGYDRWGRVTSHTDGEGNRTTYEYGPDGNVSAISLPSSSPSATGQRVTYTYFPDGRLQSLTAPNGAVTTWTYGPAGPLTVSQAVARNLTRTTTLTYTATGAKGKLETTRDPLGQLTRMGYLPVGDREWSEDPLHHRTTYEYDLLGRLQKTNPPPTTPANDTIRVSYDTLGRVWRLAKPNGSSWYSFYDGGGRRVLERRPDNAETAYQYDPYGRLSRVVDANDGVNEFQYDLMSHLLSATDARQNTTRFGYDAIGRVSEIHYPGLSDTVELITYDHAGRVATSTDRKKVTTTFAYDGLGRLTGKSYSDGTPPVTLGYDANGDTGFATSAANGADTLTWDYDLAGQLLSEGSAANGTTVSYTYDLAGHRKKLRLNGSDVLTYAFDADGQLDTVTRAAGVVFDFTPDAAHRRQSVAFPNGTLTEYGYDLLSRLSRVRLKRGASILNDITYELDEVDRRTARTENAWRQDFAFDAVSRLTEVESTVGDGPTTVVEHYTYDAVGNRLTALGTSGTWRYGEENQLLSYGGVTLGYDPNGNLVSRSASPTRSYVWDAENRLTAVRDPLNALVTYQYDPRGRRVAQAAGGVQTRFAYDDEDVLLTQAPSGNTIFLHGPGIDEPLAREAGGVRTYYHADGLGSVVRRTDAAGSVMETRAYDSFGQSTVAGGYGFTGREWSGEAELYDYRARFYDPKLGRFLSRDPAFIDGNAYAYASNNPALGTDPFGLQTVDPVPGLPGPRNPPMPWDPMPWDPPSGPTTVVPPPGTSPGRMPIPVPRIGPGVMIGTMILNHLLDPPVVCAPDSPDWETEWEKAKKKLQDCLDRCDELYKDDWLGRELCKIGCKEDKPLPYVH